MSFAKVASRSIFIGSWSSAAGAFVVAAKLRETRSGASMMVPPMHLQSTHGYTITLAHEELQYGTANAIYSIFSCNHTTRPTFEPMSWDGRCFFDLSCQGFLCCSSEMAG